MASFQQFLDNIFRPLFLVSADPSSNLPLHYFLQTIVGIDSVDDESVYDPAVMDPFVSPFEYKKKENPPYSYWAFFMAENLKQGTHTHTQH